MEEKRGEGEAAPGGLVAGQNQDLQKPPSILKMIRRDPAATPRGATTGDIGCCDGSVGCCGVGDGSSLGN